MNTAVTITLIIAAVVLANSIVIAVRDVAKAKHQACPNCGRNKNKESS
ncbi:hypothetical protein ACGFX8_32950 [Streptomyces sp. NPDC048362]